MVRQDSESIMDVADYVVLLECDAIFAVGSHVYQGWQCGLGEVLGGSS